jgi:hypothetical protein
MLDFPIASSADDRGQPSGGRLERQFAPVIPGRYRSGHLEDASLTEERYHVRAGHRLDGRALNQSSESNLNSNEKSGPLLAHFS